MKTRILPTKPKAVQFKALYKIKHYIRAYSDRNHPELYSDTEVRTRTSTPITRENLDADAYQFYDVLAISYLTDELDDTETEARNFSKLYFNHQYEPTKE